MGLPWPGVAGRSSARWSAPSITVGLQNLHPLNRGWARAQPWSKSTTSEPSCHLPPGQVDALQPPKTTTISPPVARLSFRSVTAASGRVCDCVGGSLMVCETQVTAAWVAPVRWAVGAAPWEPTLADAPARTGISQLHTPTCRFAVPSVASWIGSGAADRRARWRRSSSRRSWGRGLSSPRRAGVGGAAVGRPSGEWEQGFRTELLVGSGITFRAGESKSDR